MVKKSESLFHMESADCTYALLTRQYKHKASPHSYRNETVQATSFSSLVQTASPHSYRNETASPHSYRSETASPHSYRNETASPHSYRNETASPHSYRSETASPHSYRSETATLYAQYNCASVLRQTQILLLTNSISLTIFSLCLCL